MSMHCFHPLFVILEDYSTLRGHTLFYLSILSEGNTMGYILLGILGTVLLLLAYQQFHKRRNFLRDAEKTTATIHVEQVGGDRMFRATYSYKTKAKEDIHYVGKVQSSANIWKNTPTAEIAYPASQPQKMVIISYWGAFTPVVILACFGTVFFLLGLGSLLCNYFLGF